MLWYLSLMVCVAGAPDSSCHRTVPPIPGYVGLAACMRDGEFSMAGYKAAHAGWYISKVSCTPGSRPQAEDRA